MSSFTSKCRKCHTVKAKGDICPGCGAGAITQTMRIRKGQPISVFRVHGFHGEVAGVGRHIADGHYI